MHVRFWGTRGSIPAPGPSTSGFGGNTSCVEVRGEDGTVLILDCGTGVRQLGLNLLEEGVKRIHLLIGHTHWDHIQGFPFFQPAFTSDTELNIFAPVGFQRSLEDALAGQMQYSYFPVRLAELSGRIHFTELEEGFFRIGDFLVETQYLNHTAPTIGYRITHNGSTVVYTVDHEPFWESRGGEFPHPGDQRHIEFLRDADLLIHDAQYTDEEYQSRHGWGHSTVSYAVDIARAANVRRLALTHHDPSHDDAFVLSLERIACERALAGGSAMEVFAAREGLQLKLLGKSKPAPMNSVSALQRRPISGGRVLVVGGQLSEIADIEQILSEDALVVSGASDEQTALERALEVRPNLIVLVARHSESNLGSLTENLRQGLENPGLPVLILGSGDNHEQVGLLRATDYLSVPHSSPMLRSRIRAWLARTMIASGDRKSRSADHAQPLTDVIREEYREPPVNLAAVEFFRALTPKQRNILLARSSHHVYPAGYTVIRHGERGHGIYVILSGHVRLAESLPDNSAETYLSELRDGEVFGELALLKERTRSAAVVTLEKTSCLVIPEPDFTEVIQQSPQMALGLARVLASRLHESDRALARFGPDPLTGLPGRRAFNELYRRVSAGPRRRGKSVLLIVVDIRSLKSVNDRYGYAVGDDFLRALADVLLDSSRGTDLVSRYGGDEFAVLLVDAGVEHADRVLARIRDQFRTVTLQRGLPQGVELRTRYTVSANPPEAPDSLFQAADAGIQTDQLA